ncbi:MAG: YerC/YecD family TrpR-related protein [Clostridiales bacterium]|nr:YerC/YecD family TrpR-related protein [Clostridiales bacterium]
MKDDDSARKDFFYECVLQLKTVEECSAFFTDICARQELNAICQRMEVASLLDLGTTYSSIAEKTGASTATISRVNRSLNYGMGGYRLAMERRKEKKEKSQNG